MRQLDRLSESIDGAKRVASRSERDDFCFVRDQSLEVAPIELPSFRIHLRDVQRYPSLDYQSLPWSDVRMMFEFSNHHFIAWAKCSSERARQVIDHRGRIRTEGDLVCIGV